jgi:hypothetical protein
MPFPPQTLILGVAALMLVLRLVADRLDRQRIREDVDGRGGALISIRWSPFGRGWFGEKSDRIYVVTWQDARGQQHESHCKTSLFTGVYWSEEAPRDGAGPRGESMLEAENRRLRAEVERLKGRGV